MRLRLLKLTNYLTHLNFRSPLIFAQICTKINGSENRTHISYLKINGSTQIRSRINVYDTGCAKINGAKIRVSENWWCAKLKLNKVYIVNIIRMSVCLFV